MTGPSQDAPPPAATAADPPAAGGRGRLVVLLLALAALFVVFKTLPVGEWFKDMLAWVEGLGPWGPVLFIGVYIVACVVMAPGSILTLGAGLVFGLVKGSIIVSIAATLGATAAFLVARYVARDAVAKQVEGRPRFAALDAAVREEGFKIVLLTRLAPVFPFNLLNYFYGLTGVPLRSYMLASWLGMIPGTIMFVYFGSIAGDLAQLGEGGGETPLAQKIALGVGLVLAVAVTVFITRLAKRELATRVDLEAGEAS